MNDSANNNRTTAQLIEAWRVARVHETHTQEDKDRASRLWQEAPAERCAAEEALYHRLEPEQEQSQEPTAHRFRGCVVWAEAGRVRVLRMADDQE